MFVGDVVNWLFKRAARDLLVGLVGKKQDWGRKDFLVLVGRDFRSPMYEGFSWCRKFGCIKEGRDLLDRSYKYEFVNIDESFPKYVRENLTRFEKLINLPDN